RRDDGRAALVAQILQLRGPRAASGFRLAKLLAALKKVDPAVGAVSAEYRHFVELDQPLGKQEQAVLARLLDYGEPAVDGRGKLYLVVPRLGTISPWSSKATDIAHNCGLAGVKRIERGTVYYVDCSADLANEGIAGPLHDRMTETVLSSFDE